MARTDPYTGSFPRGRHSHRCLSCADRGQVAGVACYKSRCTLAQVLEVCEWCPKAVRDAYHERKAAEMKRDREIMDLEGWKPAKEQPTMNRATEHANTPQEATAKIDARQGHAFIDKNRRHPYICGVCGRDIKHPIHQPILTGFTANQTTTAADPEPIEEWKPTREECAAVCPDGWEVYNEGTQENEHWRARHRTHRYEIGQRATFRNDAGINFHHKIITALEPLSASWTDGIPRYYITPSDSPWCPVREDQLIDVEPGDFRVPIAYKCATCGRLGPEHGHWDINDPSTHKFKCGEPVY